MHPLYFCMRKVFILSLFVFLAYLRVKAQTSFNDTVSVVTYNINNYGTLVSNGCPTQLPYYKQGLLRTIFNYLQAPDLIGFEKIAGTPLKNVSTDTLKNKVLDSVCLGCYAYAPYTNVSTYKKANSLFYKTSKFGYISTTGIYTADNSISDINLYKLYYKSPSLSITKDTIFVNVIVVHDASGSSSASTRATEIGGAMSWLATHVKAPGNYIFMGDFNTQNSTEACFQSMINAPDTNTRFYDPPNQLGDWANNSAAFANYLTQSTRATDPGDCASTNSMLCRFDHILCTNPIMKGYNNVQYIPNSYKVIGQDGLHTGKGLIDPPTNVSAPANIINALYNMSEHLPVEIKMIISKKYPGLATGFIYFNSYNTNQSTLLKWKSSNEDEATGYIIEYSSNQSEFKTLGTLPLNNDHSGIYSFTDYSNNNNAFVQYRIKQTLKNGSFNYSDIETVTRNTEEHKLTISPNPVKSTLNVGLFSKNNTKIKIRIVNTTGNEVLSASRTLVAGLNQINYRNINTLPKGLYLLTTELDGKVYSEKFIKE